MDTVLHRIEALPGDSRYAVTFRCADASEQTAVWQLDGTDVHVADAALPPGCARDSAVFTLIVGVVSAMHAVRASLPRGAVLRDVDGGWDVGLGNVVLSPASVPTCTAHGPLDHTAGVWTCAECGARAVFG